MQLRRGNDWKQAGVVLGAVIALTAIPAALARMAPVREEIIPGGAEITLTAAGEEPDTIAVDIRADGWKSLPTGDPTSAVLNSPDGGVLLITVVNGVTDFPEAAEWRRKVLGLQAFPVAFDGGEISNQHGFAGPTCRGEKYVGVCAIMGNHNLIVSLMLTGERSGTALENVIETLRVVE
ncbi:hypothetical protein LTV02_31825 [Nocardia yamanashiensis]|uniref:hypothetical protein n=1 Tax=Nocardia yamanashiensis TaxID=209247 RepID=UPI001E4340EC|nr:hypothetical protein [Nocardia yamanashiensis]UGT40549.1 hypothetical protein LTV02_31825 [Nocardia yamanashiensis]